MLMVEPCEFHIFAWYTQFLMVKSQEGSAAGSNTGGGSGPSLVETRCAGWIGGGNVIPCSTEQKR